MTNKLLYKYDVYLKNLKSGNVSKHRYIAHNMKEIRDKHISNMVVIVKIKKASKNGFKGV